MAAVRFKQVLVYTIHFWESDYYMLTLITEKGTQPTEEEIVLYSALEKELRTQFLAGAVYAPNVLRSIELLIEKPKDLIDCNRPPKGFYASAHENLQVVQHLACGFVHPLKLAAVSVHEDGERFLSSREFMQRAQALNSLNACMADFFCERSNEIYLPRGVDELVFPKTVFLQNPEFRDSKFVSTFQRRPDGKWRRRKHVLCLPFADSYKVAVVMA